MKKELYHLAYTCLIFLAGFSSYAQTGKTGINKVPQTTLDVAGSINADSSLSLKPFVTTAAAAITSDAQVSLIQVTDDGATAANVLTLTGTPAEGQMLMLFNQDAQAVSFGSFSVSPGEALNLVYISGNWKQLSARGLTHFTETSFTTTDAGSVFTPSGTGTDLGIVLQPRGKATYLPTSPMAPQQAAMPVVIMP